VVSSRVSGIRVETLARRRHAKARPSLRDSSRRSTVYRPLLLALAVAGYFAAMSLFFEDPLFEEFAVSLALGLASRGGPELGEVQAACVRIVDGDDDSWYSAWCATAGRAPLLSVHRHAGARVHARFVVEGTERPPGPPRPRDWLSGDRTVGPQPDVTPALHRGGSDAT
jgi:hypothetical protein